ncbi:DUF3040 domain-containing protein [Pseudonocardia sp. KRD-291]|nr:DUF3040 domain-containing protein [Pseudonocardia sp. KRD291]
MLSDHELKTLRELERRLLDDDPDFPRSFTTRERRLHRPVRDAGRDRDCGGVVRPPPVAGHATTTTDDRRRAT